MNKIVQEMMDIYLGKEESNSLAHYGKGHLDGGHSGRYPWGSGDDFFQHLPDYQSDSASAFKNRVNYAKSNNYNYVDEDGKVYFGEQAVAKSMKISTTELRTELALANNEIKRAQLETANALKENGLNDSEIARRLGVTEGTVRYWYKSKIDSRIEQAQSTADFLKKQVDEKGMIDVGKDVNIELNVSKERLDQALYLLEREGYHVYGGRIDQVTNSDKKTTQKVLTTPDKTNADIYKLDEVKTINEYISRDGGETYERKFHYPESLDSKRLKVRYPDEGGAEKDGLVEIRRGVDDLSLGESRYSQVRIMVDGTHYIKGMAVYGDDNDFPDGVDVIFNTSKSREKQLFGDVLKEKKSDPDNPFGSLIKDADQGGQYWYTDKDTGEKKLGLINKRADEGDWSEWKDALPSQFLSKQSLSLAKRQLNIAKENKDLEYDDIMSIDNPTIKKYYLEKFSENCDKAAVELKAAALPGQKYYAILPDNNLSDSEIYAPKYTDGTKLALVRYPHGGTFEIPIVTVNNKKKDALIDALGKDVSDVVCINKNVAEQLSGADFDGDTVMCLPITGKTKIISTDPLPGLVGFDNKFSYGPTETKVDSNGNKHYYRDGLEYKTMKKTDNEMGRITNLITDMTLAQANDDELARAVRHSMVVIDAEKHHLDYKASEVDNDIAGLRRKYQAHLNKNGEMRYGGASTLISRSKGQANDVLKRQGTPRINIQGKSWYDPSIPEGALIYKTSDKAEYTVPKVDKKTGALLGYTTKYRTEHNVKRMENTYDAETLVSEYRHPMELVYADYANYMKSLANKARISYMNTGNLKYNSEAKEKYSEEVSSLNNKLNTALVNSIRERAAQRSATAELQKKVSESEDKIKKKEYQKMAQRAITKYRQTYNSVKRKDRFIDITDKEWEAIQAGAISENKLKKILDNTDVDSLRSRAMPKYSKGLSVAQESRIKNLRASGYTIAEIARSVGVSTSTVEKNLKS